MGIKKKIVLSPDTQRDWRVPPGQESVENLIVLHAGEIPGIDLKNWSLKIHGEVEEEKVLTYDEFKTLLRTELTADVHCVTGWSVIGTVWEGVQTKELLNVVQLKKSAEYVLVHAPGGYSANLTLEEFFAEDVLLADKFNGKPLSSEHGFPVRLVVPRRYFWKSVKWVTAIEFLKDEKPGFWEQRGYHMRGDPWEEERFSGR